MKILVIGDPHGNLPKNLPKNVDLILLNGDIGKSDLAKKIWFLKKENEVTASEKEKETAHNEIYNSSIKLLKKLSKKNEVYTIMGNVATCWSKLLKGIKGIKKVHIVKNDIRRINNLRIGFLEYFVDSSWIKEFEIKDKKEKDSAKKQTEKAKRVLNRFGKNLDILICHQPPYGILDKINFSGTPKSWQSKHAGSKIILDYIKNHQPKYCICGHIHEGKGIKKIGKTEVINLGLCGWKVLNL